MAVEAPVARKAKGDTFKYATSAASLVQGSRRRAGRNFAFAVQPKLQEERCQDQQHRSGESCCRRRSHQPWTPWDGQDGMTSDQAARE